MLRQHPAAPWPPPAAGLLPGLAPDQHAGRRAEGREGAGRRIPVRRVGCSPPAAVTSGGWVDGGKLAWRHLQAEVKAAPANVGDLGCFGGSARRRCWHPVRWRGAAGASGLRGEQAGAGPYRDGRQGQRPIQPKGGGLWSKRREVGSSRPLFGGSGGENTGEARGEHVRLCLPGRLAHLLNALVDVF